MSRLSIILEGLAIKIRLPLVAAIFFMTAGTSIWLNCPAWSTILTALGTVAGLISIWIALELFKLGNEFTRNLEKLTKDVHRISLNSAKLQHLQELRRNYWASGDDYPARIYWHFAWRFEAYDLLGLLLEDGGYLRVRVLGSNNPPLEYRLEDTQYPIYTLEVYNVQGTVNFANGRAYCTCLKDSLYISQQANEIELLTPLHKFTIVGLGDYQGSAVGQEPFCYLRFKDLNDLADAGRTIQ